MTGRNAGAASLRDAVSAGVCSVCEGHEDDHTACANALQYYLGLAEADRQRLRTALREILEYPLIGDDGIHDIAKEALNV